MKFPELQERLRQAQLDPFLVYDGRFNELTDWNSTYCQNAMSVWPRGEHYLVTQRQLDRPSRFPADTRGPEPEVFDTEEAANAYLWEYALATSRRGVRALHPDDLPAVVGEWIERCGWAPPASLVGNPFVATSGGQSYRVALVGDGAELHLFDHHVPQLSEPIASGALDDVLRSLMARIGHSARALGMPRVTAPRDLSPYTFDDIVAAFLDEQGGGILSIGLPGADVALLTEDLIAFAAKVRFFVSPFTKEIGQIDVTNRETILQLRRVPGGYVLEKFPMRPPRYVEAVVETPDLDVARAALRSLLEKLGHT